MQKIAEKFIEVMKECSHIAKNGANTFHGYKYATSADVLEKVNAALVKHGIASVATPELLSLTDVTNAKGNPEHLATVRMNLTLVDKESGEIFSITGLGSGQDSGDKAVMKAQTAAIKYAYMLSLAISAGDDPEADRWTDESTSVEDNATNQASTSVTVRPTPFKEKDAFGTICSECGAKITPKVQQFSEKRFGRPLCMSCQKSNKNIA